MPGGTAEIRHYHHRSEQVFYVLAGTLSLECDGATHTLSAGASLSVAAGSPHQAMNVGEDAVRFLVISAPSTRNDRHPS
ncbi:cupin domain-containing protein [Maribius pontilimi]|uniref:Cupin domain-containing protein n=2 Tax=Palleronia pontilimi TaxID=1964209 RepID=A0A934MEW6_9RHOB|nr:cupin domain-containing protein [Palleronia pontilimi]MBJ3763876.1 cupin domain-containing protein [Palleronia pontilimi]